MKLFNLATLILILALFAMPAFAQDSPVTPELPEWAMGLPSVLVQMVSLNFAATEIFKRYLSNEALPFTPDAKTRSLLVLIASFVVGVASVFMYPDSLSYVPESAHPVLQYLFVGASVSVLGGFVHDIKTRLAPSSAATTSTSITSTTSTPVSEAKG